MKTNIVMPIQKNKILIRFGKLLLAGTLMMTAGCATTTTQALPFEFEVDQGKAIKINSVQARASENGILVFGTISKGALYSIPQGAHLHIFAMKAGNAIIGNEIFKINPHMLQHGLRGQSTPATYTAQIAVSPDSVSTIKIVYHNHAHADCLEKDSKRAS